MGIRYVATGWRNTDNSIGSHSIEFRTYEPSLTVTTPSLTKIVERVRELCSDRKRVLVILDSNHTHDHVRLELDAYSPFVTEGSYLVVFDTVIEEIPTHSSATAHGGGATILGRQFGIS